MDREIFHQNVLCLLVMSTVCMGARAEASHTKPEYPKPTFQTNLKSRVWI